MVIVRIPDNYHQIDTVWAAVSVNEDGEGLCAVMQDGAWMPLVAADESRLEWLKSMARILAEDHGYRIKIIKLTQRVDIEQIWTVQ